SLTIPTPSFTLSSKVSTVTLAPGGSSTIKITTAVLNGFKSALALSVSGLPAGVTANFLPAGIASPGSGSSTLTLKAASDPMAGSYDLTVTATGGGLTKTLNPTLKVAAK